MLSLCQRTLILYICLQVGDVRSGWLWSNMSSISRLVGWEMGPPNTMEQPRNKGGDYETAHLLPHCLSLAAMTLIMIMLQKMEAAQEMH